MRSLDVRDERNTWKMKHIVFFAYISKTLSCTIEINMSPESFRDDVARAKICNPFHFPPFKTLKMKHI